MDKTVLREDIKIRHAEPGDYQAIQEIYNCPKAFSGTLQLPYPSQEMWRKRLADPPDGTYNLVAVVDGKVVGQLGIHTFPHRPRRRHVATFGIGVHDNWQGKGIGRALLQACVDMADNWLNVTRLELEVYTDNEPAIHLYKSFGFELEGTKRMDAFRDGRYVDSHIMARLRPSQETLT
jgi:putative acetyltransferase